jgi:hypothetical protein
VNNSATQSSIEPAPQDVGVTETSDEPMKDDAQLAGQVSNIAATTPSRRDAFANECIATGIFKGRVTELLCRLVW